MGSGVRQVRVEPLGRHEDADRVAVRVVSEVPETLKSELATALRSGLGSTSGLEVVEAEDARAFRAEIRVLDVSERAPELAKESRARGVARNTATRFGMGSRSAGRLMFDVVLRPPDGGEPVGQLRFDGRGGVPAREAGQVAGERLGREIAYQRDRFVKRRAADERLFLTPTPLTLEKGEWLISDDELLLVRAGVGLHRRVQLDAWLGGLPLYGPLGTGGGAAFFGVIDLGLKVAVLEEGRVLPGLSVSYDFLNVFGAGGVAMIVPHGGALAAGTVGNAQFNLFTVATSKHFWNTQLVLGSYFLDNHHFVPQGAVFATQSGAGTKSIERLPLQVQPFVGLEQVFTPRFSLAAEFLPRTPFRHTLGSFGARWLIGGSEPKGPVALDRIRFRIDAAGIFGRTASGRAWAAPWLGIGLYVARRP